MATKPYPCIVVDDDEIDRLTTIAFIKKFPELNIAGTYTSAEEALHNIGTNAVDVAFLDVDMPGMSGLDLRKRIEQIPVAVFITSYPDYAVESFDLAALDFIVKPIKLDRFTKTVERIIDFFNIRNKAALLDHSLGAESIFIKDGFDQVKIQLHDILYLEALKDYTSIVTTNNKHCVLSSIGNLLKEPGFQSFIRIHRSFAVQKNYIERVNTREVFLKNISLPVGRMYKETLSTLKK
ncbi:MAG: LytTR family DNA-binding domain-containing protein [Chitinophagaceae bacterium]